MKKLITMREALSDPELLGSEFRGASWLGWRAIMLATVGELHTDEEADAFTKLTGGREHGPSEPAEVLLVVAGRRSGKTKAMSALSVYLSTMVDWTDNLSLGERGVCLFMAPVERMALEAHRYSAALIDKLAGELVESRTQDTLVLKNGITLETRAANWRSARGFTSVCVALDECAFLRSEEDSANPDIEILRAVRPTLSTTGGPCLLTSSPNTMVGIVHRLWKKHYGKDGDERCLVVQSDSTTLNPTLRQSVVDRAYEQDPEEGLEYSGTFREPVSAYLARSLVEAAVEKGVGVRPVLPGVQYVGVVDASSGVSKDAFAFAIGHLQKDGDRNVVVVDLVQQEKPPFNVDAVTEVIAHWFKSYRISEVYGDGFGLGWVQNTFARNMIGYRLLPLSASDLYLYSLPAWSARRVSMLDAPLAIDQLCNLRRRIGSGGVEKVVHLGQQHDDMANVIAALIWRLIPSAQSAGFSTWDIPGVVFGPGPPKFGENSTEAYLRSIGRVNTPSLLPTYPTGRS